MTICGQTLILVDCDDTVSEVNQKIIRSTLKYMMYHLPENRAFCISTYGHTADNEEQFVTDVNDLVCTADLLEFGPKDSNLTDTLCDTITKWKESDFACRDIVVFTDGLEDTATDHEDEELYYLLNNTSYPIYVVDLVQDGNDGAKKHLSAISTISGGKLFYSEYPGDDAGVDKTLSEEIYSEMDQYAKTEWAKYEDAGNPSEAEKDEEGSKANLNFEEAADDGKGGKESDKNDSDRTENTEGSLNDDNTGTDEENHGAENDLSDLSEDDDVILIDDEQLPFFESTVGVVTILGIVLGLVIGGIALSLVYIKKRKENAKEDREIQEIVKNNTCSQELFTDDGFTTMLTMGMGEGTRLLNSDEVHRIELISYEHCDPLEIMCGDKTVCVGRSTTLSDIRIDDDSVSKRHCRFYYENGGYYVEDLESSNGTYINDEKIHISAIKTGDMIKIGRSEFKVKCYG